MPRLVQKGGCRLESYLDGTLMIFVHRDMPGVIGRVGSIFGRHQVNIAQMSVGRRDQPARRRGDRRAGPGLASRRPRPWRKSSPCPMSRRAWVVKAAACRRIAPLDGRVKGEG